MAPKVEPAPKAKSALKTKTTAAKAKSKAKAKATGPGLMTITRPRGARVYVDGKRLRTKVPFRKLRVKTGKRRVIKIVKRRYVRVFEVDIKSGAHVDVTGGRQRIIED